MVINKVPKFIEQRMAQKRRERKTGPQYIAKQNVSGFESAKKRFDQKLQQKSVKEEAIAQKEAKLAEKAKIRKKEGKHFNNRNQKGQPNMGSQLEVLLSRFNR